MRRSLGSAPVGRFIPLRPACKGLLFRRGLEDGRLRKTNLGLSLRGLVQPGRFTPQEKRNRDERKPESARERENRFPA